MGRLTLVTGGAGSGKSRYALDLAASWGTRILFIATCVPGDDEMRSKVARHRAERPPGWATVEANRGLGEALRPGHDGAVIDCLTLLVSQMLVANENDDVILREVSDTCDAARRADYPCVLVTNEVGCGLVPESSLGRRFRELAGRCNQVAARCASDVKLIVCGIPVCVKNDS